ncbi:hypothetical protein D9M71_419560 [compost metagenome]
MQILGQAHADGQVIGHQLVHARVDARHADQVVGNRHQGGRLLGRQLGVGEGHAGQRDVVIAADVGHHGVTSDTRLSQVAVVQRQALRPHAADHRGGAQRFDHLRGEVLGDQNTASARGDNRQCHLHVGAIATILGHLGSRLLVTLGGGHQAHHLRHLGARHRLAIGPFDTASRGRGDASGALVHRHRSGGRSTLSRLCTANLVAEGVDLALQFGELAQLLGSQGAAVGLDLGQRLELGIQLGAFATHLKYKGHSASWA